MVSASYPDAVSGISLLAVYSLGLGVPFLLTALFVDRFFAHVKSLRRWSRPVYVGSGVLMVLMGVLMITGQLTALSYWLLDAFPALGRIG